MDDHTLSGRKEGSSQVMKKGLGMRPESANRDIAATRQVSRLPSGLSLNIGAVSALSLSAIANAPSGVSTQKVTSDQGRLAAAFSRTSL